MINEIIIKEDRNHHQHHHHHHHVREIIIISFYYYFLNNRDWVAGTNPLSEQSPIIIIIGVFFFFSESRLGRSDVGISTEERIQFLQNDGRVLRFYCLWDDKVTIMMMSGDDDADASYNIIVRQEKSVHQNPSNTYQIHQNHTSQTHHSDNLRRNPQDGASVLPVRRHVHDHGTARAELWKGPVFAVNRMIMMVLTCNIFAPNKK